MKLTNNQRADKIRELRAALDANAMKTNDDARSFICTLIRLIYDYKMPGLVLDYYSEDTDYYKQDKIRLTGAKEIKQNIIGLLATFPDLTTDIKSTVVYKVSDDFFKVAVRLNYHGTCLGASRFGPATGKELGDSCQNMRMLHLRKAPGGEWKIVFEINNDCSGLIRRVCTAD